MKTTLIPMAVLLLICSLPQIACGQNNKRLDGNGRITTQQKALKEVTSVVVRGSWANVFVTCGAMPKLEIMIDENLQSNIICRMEGQTLYLEAEGWIEPTKVQLRLQVPYLTQIEVDGWVDIEVERLDVPEMTILGDVGRVTLAGRADKLFVSAHKTELDIQALRVKSIEGSFTGRGSISYRGNPEFAVKGEARMTNLDVMVAPNAEIQYVDFTLYNNRFKTTRLVVQGPPQRSFSYGFSLGAYGKKKERWPVGTQLYVLDDGFGKQGRLLLEISPNRQGQRLPFY